ncbi:MAG: hypothetical protein QM764_07775 [Chitinophagaceae bacterium]
MEELLYADLEGQYFLLDYSSSHSEMIIRRINKEDPDNVFNIDLFFKAVYNIQLATKLTGIKIYKITRHSENILMPNIVDRKEIYKIVDREGNVGFIDASIFVVFHNTLGILTTSLGDFTWTKENREIFSIVIH